MNYIISAYGSLHHDAQVLTEATTHLNVAPQVANEAKDNTDPDAIL